MTTLAAACGALVGLGVFLATAGLRGVVSSGSSRPRSPLSRARREGFVARLALAAGAAIVVLLATRWMVGAVLAGALGAAAPTLFGGGAQRARAIARIEAIAAWTEMLRDVTAAGAGLQEALAATAPVARCRSGPRPKRWPFASSGTAWSPPSSASPTRWPTPWPTSWSPPW